MRWETFKHWDLLWLILEIWQCPFMQSGHASMIEIEFAALVCKSTDLVGLKGTYKPVFLYTTDVNLSPRQRSQIPSGNSDIGLSLLHLLRLLGLLGLGRWLAWFATKTGPCFLHPRGSQAWDATSIPSKTATWTTYRFFCIRLCHVELEQNVDGAAALPGHHFSLSCRRNLVFFCVGAPTPSWFPEWCASSVKYCSPPLPRILYKVHIINGFNFVNMILITIVQKHVITFIQL